VIVLLDTHTYLWMDADQSKLSVIATAVVGDPAHTLLVSSISILEIVIKVGLGKLSLRDSVDALVKRQQANRVNILPVLLDHALEVGKLPTPHKDPFDRVLAAQAIIEGADLLTKDPIFSQYPVRVIW
jgi:PIN domain nuclease of toxin-antitoxin system